MSTTPDPQPPRDDADPRPEGDDVELHTVLDPASVRRAPRYKGFLVAGGILGLLIGLALGLYLLATFDPRRDLPMDKPGVWLTVTVMGTMALTTLLAGLLATILDRRSLRRWNAQQDADRDV